MDVYSVISVMVISGEYIGSVAVQTSQSIKRYGYGGMVPDIHSMVSVSQLQRVKNIEILEISGLEVALL